MKNNKLAIILNGFIKENPVLVLVLGTCPTLAVTTSAINGIGMGVSTMAVLICSNIFIALLRKIIPDEIRIPCFIVVIATFVTIIEFALKAYVPSLYASLGLFIPLIVVNCIILGRAESFASKNKVIPAAIDGICQGLGYTLVLLAMSSIREVLGNGSFAGIQLFPSEYGAMLLTLPVGGFLSLGGLIALMQWALAKSKGGK